MNDRIPYTYLIGWATKDIWYNEKYKTDYKWSKFKSVFNAIKKGRFLN